MFLVLFSFLGIAKLKTNDDIRLLYSSNATVLANEKLTREILNNQQASQFFLITGQNPQEVLQKEEILTQKLEELIQENKINSYTSISQFIPSIDKQNTNYLLIKEKLMQKYFKQHGQELGLSPEQILNIQQDFTNSYNKKLQLSNLSTQPIFELIKPLWLGKINNQYASIVLLNNISDLPALQKLNQEKNGIYFLDKVGEISDTFKQYRNISFKLLLVVYSVILILLLLRYGYKKTIFIFIPSTLAALLSFGILGYLGYSLNLFHILGLFLVLGIGFDYAIFYAESNDPKHHKQTVLAIFLSSITTLMSFGLLAFSSFPVIHSFGLIVFLGILFAYLFAPIAILQNKNQV